MTRLVNSNWTQESFADASQPMTEWNSLRHDLHPVTPGNWVRKAHRLSSMADMPSVYAWAEIHDRLARLAQIGRHDQATFVRHGSTKYNQRGRVSGQHNTLLSELGKKQAQDLQKQLQAHPDLIACSTLARTIETMELSIPEKDRIGVPIIIDPRLNEVNLGTLQGRRRDYIDAFGAGDLDFAPPTGESYRHAAQRVFSFVIDLFETFAEQGGPQSRAIVFSHAGVLRMVATLVKNTSCARDLFKVNMSAGRTGARLR